MNDEQLDACDRSRNSVPTIGSSSWMAQEIKAVVSYYGDPYEIEEKVNTLLEQGWKLHGDIMQGETTTDTGCRKLVQFLKRGE